MAINPMASCTFFFTNCDKVQNGQVARTSVAAAQGYKVLRWCGETFDKLNHYVNDFDNIAKTNTMGGKAARGLTWLGNNVNPLITACVATKILTSDDKEKAFCTDGAGLMGMFAAEGQFKKFAKSGLGQELLAKVHKAGGKYGKMAAIVAEGGLFAATSIAGYGTAAKIGETCIEAERAYKKEKAQAKAEGTALANTAQFECIA